MKIVKTNFLTYARQIIFLIIGLLILWLVTRNQDLGKIWFYLTGANFYWLLPAIAAGILSHYTRALRWKILINSQGTRAKSNDVFYAVMAGYTVNLVVPRLGELTKCIAITKYYGTPLNRVTGTMVAERIIDVVTLMLLMIITIATQWGFLGSFLNQLFFARLALFVSENPIWLIILILLLTSTAVLLVFYVKKWLKSSQPGSLAARLKEQIVGFKEGLLSVFLMEAKLRFILLTVVIWCFYFLTAYFGFLAIDATRHLSPMAGVTLLAMGSLGILAPVPAGIGTYHFITIATLTLLYEIGTEPATSYAYLSHIMQVFLILATTGTLWLFRFLTKARQYRNQAPAKSMPISKS